MSEISQDSISDLQSGVAGRVVTPASTDYDEVRAIWNGMIDKRPAIIVQCAGGDDVAPSIEFARTHGLELAIRGAGHNIAGNSLCDDGLVIDFSNMKDVRVDAAARRAYVQPGATLADLDAATQAHGLATPVGINSTTGISGLTLGGGFGWLSRKYGMTVDNLISASVVTADGRAVKASASENSDLFWAIRGGGGNFGVVTEFEFALHPVGPEILAGLVAFPFSQVKQVLHGYRAFIEGTPEEFNTWVVMRKAPPLPFLPEEVHGQEVAICAVFYAGENATDGERYLETIKGFGDPHGVHAGPMPYVDWQQAFDPLLTPGLRNYWKTHNFTELADGALDAMAESSSNLPTPHCEVFIGFMGGAPNRVDSGAMAYGARDAVFVMNVHGRWESADEDEAVIGWARNCFATTKPFASDGAYVNFMTDEEGERVESAYGSNYAKLASIKAKYDPDNLFRHNQNVRPAAG